MRRLMETFRDTFSDIWFWTAMCAFGLLPGFGTIPAAIIVGGLKIILTALKLNPLAEWLCHSMCSDSYLDASALWLSMCLDLVRIWVISYILISVIRFVYELYTNRKKVPA